MSQILSFFQASAVGATISAAAGKQNSAAGSDTMINGGREGKEK